MLQRTILSFLLLGAPCAALAVAPSTTPASTQRSAPQTRTSPSTSALQTIAFEVDNRAFGRQVTGTTPGAKGIQRPKDPGVEQARETGTDHSPWQATATVIASLMLVVFMARRA